MISIRNVSKSYQQGTEVLKDINLEIRDQELVVLLGESGSGKTTLLKMINRLISMSKGDILIDGKSINEIDPVELRRGMGYVVQQTGLFPHLTVQDNIEMVSKLKKEKPEHIKAKTAEVMRMVGLAPEEFLKRYPRELSGGQAQRVGVARAYATEPDIILMDEPFSALDPITRAELQKELLELQKKSPKTIVFVTHDIAEAIKLADRIVLLNNGVIEQVGTPRELLIYPKSEYVSRFLGDNRVWKTPWILQCKDIMSEIVTCVNVNDDVETAWELIKKDDVQAIIVTDDNNRAVGKLTEKIMMRKTDAKSIRELMKTQFDYTHIDTPLHDAVKLMNEKDILYLPVLNQENQLMGMLSMTDLMMAFDDNVLSEQR